MNFIKFIALFCIVGAIVSATIQNESFSCVPTYLAVAFSFLGFGLAVFARRKNRKDVFASCLLISFHEKKKIFPVAYLLLSKNRDKKLP